MFLVGSLQAEQPRWEVVRADPAKQDSTVVQWTFTIRNTSGQRLTVAEDWSVKGKASANFYLSLDSFGAAAGMKLFAEPCHAPKSHLQVEPGATITAVVPDVPDIDRNKLTLTIIEEGNVVAIGTLENIANKGQQGGADQPATAPESKPKGDSEPNPESEGRPE